MTNPGEACAAIQKLKRKFLNYANDTAINAIGSRAIVERFIVFINCLYEGGCWFPENHEQIVRDLLRECRREGFDLADLESVINLLEGISRFVLNLARSCETQASEQDIVFAYLGLVVTQDNPDALISSTQRIREALPMTLSAIRLNFPEHAEVVKESIVALEAYYNIAVESMDVLILRKEVTPAPNAAEIEGVLKQVNDLHFVVKWKQEGRSAKTHPDEIEEYRRIQKDVSDWWRRRLPKVKERVVLLLSVGTIEQFFRDCIHYEMEKKRRKSGK